MQESEHSMHRVSQTQTTTPHHTTPSTTDSDTKMTKGDRNSDGRQKTTKKRNECIRQLHKYTAKPCSPSKVTNRHAQQNQTKPAPSCPNPPVLFPFDHSLKLKPIRQHHRRDQRPHIHGITHPRAHNLDPAGPQRPPHRRKIVLLVGVPVHGQQGGDPGGG